MTRKGRSRLVLTGPQTDCLVGHCHVGQFYLSMARRAYGPPTAKSMACRVREWRWTPRESAILGRRDNAPLIGASPPEAGIDHGVCRSSRRADWDHSKPPPGTAGVC